MVAYFVVLQWNGTGGQPATANRWEEYMWRSRAKHTLKLMCGHAVMCPRMTIPRVVVLIEIAR